MRGKWWRGLLTAYEGPRFVLAATHLALKIGLSFRKVKCLVQGCRADDPCRTEHWKGRVTLFGESKKRRELDLRVPTSRVPTSRWGVAPTDASGLQERGKELR